MKGERGKIENLGKWVRKNESEIENGEWINLN